MDEAPMDRSPKSEVSDTYGPRYGILLKPVADNFVDSEATK